MKGFAAPVFLINAVLVVTAVSVLFVWGCVLTVSGTRLKSANDDDAGCGGITLSAFGFARDKLRKHVPDAAGG